MTTINVIAKIKERLFTNNRLRMTSTLLWLVQGGARPSRVDDVARHGSWLRHHRPSGAPTVPYIELHGFIDHYVTCVTIVLEAVEQDSLLVQRYYKV